MSGVFLEYRELLYQSTIDPRTVRVKIQNGRSLIT